MNLEYKTNYSCPQCNNFELENIGNKEVECNNCKLIITFDEIDKINN